MDGKVAEVAGKHPVAANTHSPARHPPPSMGEKEAPNDYSTVSPQGSSCIRSTRHPATPRPMPGDLPLDGTSPCNDSHHHPTPSGAAICSVTRHQGYSVVQGSPPAGSPNAKCKAAGDGWMEIGEGERKAEGATKRHTQLAGAHLQLLGGLFPLIKHLAVLPVL